MDDTRKIYWHGPIFEALQLVFDGNDLDYKDEFPLGKEAIIVDAIITKDNNVHVNKDIAYIFKGHNLFEFKSPKASFSIFDYVKTIGYAGVYSSFKKVLMTDITITIILTMFPRKLVKFLENERNIKVRDIGNGIYYIEGESFPIQILESKKLSEGNLFLRNLRDDLSVEDMKATLEAYADRRQVDKRSVYIDRLSKANPTAFKEAMKMVTEYTADIILEAFEESGRLIERDIEMKKKAARKMLLDGTPVEKVCEWLELPHETVAGLV